MSGLEEVLGSEELDFEYDLDEEQEKARLARAAQKQDEDENDAVDLSVEVSEKIDEDKKEEVCQIQPKHPAISVHSRLGEKVDEDTNKEDGHIQPKHPAISIHSRLGPRKTPSEQEESQEHVVEESQANVNREELEGDDESRSLGDDKDEDDDDDDDDDEEEEDEDSRRTRFKSERKNISQNISLSLTTTKPNRNIPDSLDDVIRGNYSEPRGNYSEPRRSPFNRSSGSGSVFSRLQRPNSHQKGLETKNLRFRTNGPNDGIGSLGPGPGPLMDIPIYPVPNRPAWQSNFNEDFTSDYCFENFGNTQTGTLDKNDLRYSIGTGGDVRSRLGGSVTNSQFGQQTGVPPVAASHAGNTTTALKRPHGDDFTDNRDFAKQMKQDLLHGKSVISILVEMYRGKVKFVEKQIGNVHLPEFECSVEIEGKIHKGIGKSKKLAKKMAAETALAAVMQTGDTPVAASQAAKTTTVNPQNGTTTPLVKYITPAETDKPVAESQPVETTTVTPQNGTTTPLGKGIIPAEAQTTTSLTTPYTDDATESTDTEKQMKLKLPDGINAISTLNEMYKGKLRFVDKALGDALCPHFECTVEIEDETYKGDGKQKKIAKKMSAEVALLGLMQNWINGKSPEPGQPQLILGQLMDRPMVKQHFSRNPQ